MQKELEEIRIQPAKNGGHTVRHGYKAKPVHSKSHGMHMDYPQSEEFVFGPDDHGKLMAHVSKHLGLKGKEAAYEQD